MKVLVGYSADSGGTEALALGLLMARAGSGSLVVCTIVPETWGHPSMARVDAEYAQFLDQHAQKALEKARLQVGGKVPADYVCKSASAVREGLLEVAAREAADCVVLGSARGAPRGHIRAGSVNTGFLHTAPVPIALTPRGYAPEPSTRLCRVTCAVSPAPESMQTVRTAHQLCGRMKVPLRLVTFVVRDRQMYPTGAGYDVENLVANQWRAQGTEGQNRIIAALPPEPKVTAGIADGKSWKAAFESVAWKGGEIMAVGSSNLGPLLRVFLGSNATTIVRHATVPCLILPRHAA
ncbi:universal stress protein [Dongia sp.]|uniref:universal stress protein n=1 Tax=Dongia sp. TaxID=1977262 RepID=UPI0037528D21